VYDSSDEEELVPVWDPTFSAGDYVHSSEEEDVVVTQVAAISAAEARARFRREEADVVRQVREYEAVRQEERVRHVKLEIVSSLTPSRGALHRPPGRRRPPPRRPSSATTGTAARRGQLGLLLLRISLRG
jgi:hypothetical protein